jgi:hypothetical protein
LLRFRDAANSIPWNLSLKFENYEKIDIEPLLQSNRRFRSVSLDGSLMSQFMWSKNKLVEILTKHGSWVKELKLFSCCIDNIELFAKIMLATPKLKKLVMTHTAGMGEFKAENLPSFDKLETLEFLTCEYRMLDCLKNAKLSTFKVMSNDGPDQDMEPLIEFLASQKNLKSLALRWFESDSSQLFKAPLYAEKISFKLKKLSLLKFKLRQTPNDYSNLLMFLQTQAKSVEELEIGHAFPDFIFEFVFSKFMKLRKLKININGIPSDMEVYNRLVTNTSVETLVIAGTEPDSIEAVQEFMHHLPNVESLTFCESQSEDLMTFVSTNFVRLRYLNAWNINGLQSPTVEIINIKTIATTDWNLIHGANPKITEIHVKGQMFGAETSIIQMIEVLNLSVLRIGGLFSADSNFFEAVRANLTKYKQISIARKSLQVPESEVADIPKLCYLSELDIEVINKFDVEFWNESDYGPESDLLFGSDDGEASQTFEFNDTLEESVNHDDSSDDDPNDFWDYDDFGLHFR